MTLARIWAALSVAALACAVFGADAPALWLMTAAIVGLGLQFIYGLVDKH